MLLWRPLKVLIVGSLIFAVSFVAGTSLEFFLSRWKVYGSTLENWEYQPSAKTKLYTADGEIIMELGYEREYQKDFPTLLKRGVVAVEDKRFYEHSGIDPKGILRALWTDIRLGERAQGGSTITQQLARTLFLSNEKSLLRKTKEMFLAIALERKYTKDEILNMYLNEIYMGRGVCGMGAAAKAYFGKSVWDLNLAEIAYLIAMISAPERYSPDHEFNALKERQAMVLDVMVENGVTDPGKAAAAKKKQVNFKPEKTRDLMHPYFTTYVLAKLKEEYGEDAIYRGGLKVYTTLNEKAQKTAEEITKQHMAALAREHITAKDVALVSVEPASGAIRALVGGVNFSNNQYNMVIVPRQPGSAIKPLFYAAAMEEGYIRSDTVLNNKPRNFNDYKPENHPPGPDKVTAHLALVNSYNVASVEVLNTLGVEKGISYLERFGIDTITPEDYHLAIALGGFSKGVTPLALASAYGVFANNGTLAQPYVIEKITDAAGHIIYHHKISSQRVISPSTAQAITSILKDVIRYGTGQQARIRLTAAGKTGTTSGSRDLWFVGYTPELSTAVWLGNTDGSPIKGAATWGGTRCGPIWRDYMNQLISKGLITHGVSGDTVKETEPTVPDEETAPGETSEIGTPEGGPVPEQDNHIPEQNSQIRVPKDKNASPNEVPPTSPKVKESTEKKTSSLDKKAL